MASKKYTLTAALALALTSGGFAQMGGVYDYNDSSKISPKRMAQHTEWLNNSPTNPFPARPRDMWQLGVYGGLFGVSGDVPPVPGYNFGLSLRKALGYVISVRGSFGYAQAKGLDYKPNNNFRHRPDVLRVYDNPTVGNPGGTGQGFYVHSFRTTAFTPSLDFLVSLNNIMFHRKQSNWNFYGLVGYMPFVYKTEMDLVRGSRTQPQAYNWSGINFDAKRKDIRSQLRDLMDGEYESPARVRPRRQNFDDADESTYNWRHTMNLGLGLERRLGNRVSLGAEIKYTITWDDYIDGWFLNNNLALTPQNDALLFTNLHLNFNLGNAAKRTAPLWWLNPLGYSYSELNNPSHMKFPKPILDDSDNDGVADQFDLEPNTPAGCPVDTRGRSRDTDGDGVPDCRDKELITPTACQPVDADGVGKCPDPECCKNVRPANECNIGSLPSVQFASGRAALSSSAQAILDAAAASIKANPSCKICVVGHGGASKREQQLSWDRVNAVINYLVERQGISRDRFVFKYGEFGDANTVDLQDCTGEDGPNMVPAPHPQYRRTN